MRALIVDGPSAGEIVNPAGVRFNLPVFLGGDSLKSVHYFLHQFRVADQTIWLASVHSTPDEIRMTDVADVILSDKAKELING